MFSCLQSILGCGAPPAANDPADDVALDLPRARAAKHQIGLNNYESSSTQDHQTALHGLTVVVVDSPGLIREETSPSPEGPNQTQPRLENATDQPEPSVSQCGQRKSELCCSTVSSGPGPQRRTLLREGDGRGASDPSPRCVERTINPAGGLPPADLLDSKSPFIVLPPPQPDAPGYGPQSPHHPPLSISAQQHGSDFEYDSQGHINPGAGGMIQGGGSGLQPPYNRQHLATEDMPVSSSLSEPLLQSCSPGSYPPYLHQQQIATGSTAITAITATSGGGDGGTAGTAPNAGYGGGGVACGGAPWPQPHPDVWTASASPPELAAMATKITTGAATAAATRPRLSIERTAPVGSGMRERKPLRSSQLGVECSAGSRLGWPELAVVGPGAAAVAAAPDATVMPAVWSTATSSQRSDAVASGGGSRGGGGSRALGGMLGVMTRRLLMIVQDVGSAVSQASFFAGSHRADSTASASAPPLRAESAAPVVMAAVESPAVYVRQPGNTGRMTSGHAADMGRVDSASGPDGSSGGAVDVYDKVRAATARSGPLPAQRQREQPLPRHQPQQQQQQQVQQLPVQGPHLLPTSAGASSAPLQQNPEDHAPAAALAAAAAAATAGAPYPPYAAARGSLRAGSDSGSGLSRRVWEDIGVVQVHGAPHAPYPVLPLGAGTSQHATRPTQRDASQIAMLQMMHFGCTSGRVPLSHLDTLNVTALSREIRALHWIGQGGGGAVFQGVWQGAPVAVKFMLAARPEHVDATALEAVVSVAVGHPNVVTTYSFDMTRLTEASFLPDPPHPHHHPLRFSQYHPAAAVAGGGGGAEDSSATALYNALMETDASLEAGGVHRHHRHHQHQHYHQFQHPPQHPQPGGTGAGAAGAETPTVAAPHRATNSQLASYRAENLSMRVRRSQAVAVAALTNSSSAGAIPTSDGAAEAEAAAGPGAAAAAADSWIAPRGAVPAVPIANHQRQLQQHQARQAHHGAAPASVETLEIQSAFNSEEGFGDPDLTDNSQSWTVRHVLSYLKARPGMCMTHIIMEYCDRGSLLSAIKRGIFRMEGLPDDDGGGGGPSYGTAAPTPTPPDQPRFTKRVVLRALLRTARDIAQGMCHLHANGIIHGDLKPGNVLLRGCRSDRRGFTALVSDFGLSKITRGDKPLELNHWSTVTVMAPEVIMGRWLKASDVFSFGILLWQLVAGEMMPYGNATVQQVLLGVAQGVLKPEWPASAQPPLVRLGRACLATSPEKRPSFEAIVKILIKIEQHVRNELRTPRDTAAAVAGAAGHDGLGVNSSRYSRYSSGSENVAAQLNRLRSSAM